MSVHCSVHLRIGLVFKTGHGQCSPPWPLNFSLWEIHVQSERLTQLKDAVKQLGLSATPGVSAPVNKAPCSSRQTMTRENIEQTSTPATLGIQNIEHPLTFLFLPLLLDWITEPSGGSGRWVLAVCLCVMCDLPSKSDWPVKLVVSVLSAFPAVGAG